MNITDASLQQQLIHTYKWRVMKTDEDDVQMTTEEDYDTDSFNNENNLHETLHSCYYLDVKHTPSDDSDEEEDDQSINTYDTVTLK